MAYASYKGTKIFYEVRGRGLPLVFIHPPAMSHLTFRYQYPLSFLGKVVVLDLPGNGHSKDKNTKALSIEEQAECVRVVLKKLRAKKAIIIGYSNGGSIAQEFALRFPEITSGLILLGGFPEVATFMLDKEFKLGMWAAKKRWMSLISYVLPKAHFKNKIHAKEMQSIIQEVDPNWLSETYKIGHEYQSIHRLNQLNMPLLLVYGKQDIIMHHYIYDFVKKAHDVEVVLVSGVAHQVPTKRQDECNQVISEWLKRRELV
ncbi:alpha/beta hydrolase [Alkalihalophilus lindianensis]|uniref:Alpha/beta hydrolase n=1 Tax=Alkalihalophilus lindianensis TaxID=1630542 RepID=A0ABU3X9J0_9BACI|nr:alpha/beta hydrolase [Alkalihalophilus lindianensis]MDV2684556.1 alpha/beta hydrolase [Alkalihalophilus lindianensis]